MKLSIWNLLKKKKSKEKLLEKEIVEYYRNRETVYSNSNIKASVEFLKKHKNGFHTFDFLKIWLAYNKNDGKYFDFNGAKLPDISNDIGQMKLLLEVYADTFLFFCLLNDNYDKTLVEQFEPLMMEGPYGYVYSDFDVTIKKNDVVIDAGAWIGDFSAYAATKNAIVYAFEPISINYDTLVKTASLNDNKIIPVKKALGDKNEKMEILIPENDTMAASSFLLKSGKKETMEVITLDGFVEKEKIQKVDFIKADIEGAEKYLLIGAKKVLKEFAPKLAICTYHNPEDPKLLEKIILEANPKYCVIHTNHKLFATIK